MSMRRQSVLFTSDVGATRPASVGVAREEAGPAVMLTDLFLLSTENV